jgi:signal transduction histidine kinase
MVTGDADMIKSVIRNLLSNALKFTNSDGCITISSYDAGMIEKNLPETVKKTLSVNSPVEIISVMDTGIGIEPEKLINLFDKSADFTQSGTENEKGTGIGLILCKEYINMHDGTIWAESIPGKGSTFYFTLQKKN